MKRHNFKELHIWRLAMDIVDDIYDITEKFPDKEKFGLTLQMRKAVVSTPSNIAEGCGRGTSSQLEYFLDIALGSSYELETQSYIAIRRRFCTPEVMNPVIEKMQENQRMTLSFRENHLEL